MRPLAFVLASTGHGSMIVNRNDWCQLPDGGVYGVGFQILSRGSYDADEVGEVLETLRNRRANFGDGVVAIDCGANIGVHTLEMGHLMQSWGTVTAFEPQERLFYALCGNIALANLFNVNAVLAAVGAEDGEIPVPCPDYNKSGSFGSLEIRYNPKTEYIGQKINYNRGQNKVRLVAIDGMKLERLDFLKIDVEGMELDVLSGARETITRCRPDMLIEWIKTDRVELESVLSSFGYDFVEASLNLKATPKL